MAKGKYTKDYRLIEEFREDGRVRTGYEYIGAPYYFEGDRDVLELEKRKALSLIVFACAAFIGSLILYTAFMHSLFVALPFAFNALPLFTSGELIFGMNKWKEPLEHRHADRINNSYPAQALAIMYLSGIALIGEAVLIIKNGITAPGDAVMAFCTAVIFACGFALFRKRKVFRTAERSA